MQVSGLPEILSHPTVREAELYERAEGGRVRCLLCERRCLLNSGQTGFCKTRASVGNRLYTVVYGDISSISANPIEKKPFFHFHPGTRALTVGTWGCNFACPWCQNYRISKSPPNPPKATYLSPEELVRISTMEKCQGTSISFNEPTLLFEYALDVFPLARRCGLYNTYVSNGYMTAKALETLKDAGLDAIKFDVKGSHEAVRRYCAADVEVVWRNVRRAAQLGLHVEAVALIIPGINDSPDVYRDLASHVLDASGPDTPLHFTRFYPAYKMANRPPTPLAALEEAREIGVKEGLRYVYLGNVPGHPLENTHCHSCGRLLIRRYGFDAVESKLTANRQCPRCGTNIPIITS